MSFVLSPDSRRRRCVFILAAIRSALALMFDSKSLNPYILRSFAPLALARLDQFNQIAHAPQPVRDSCRHRRSATRRLMNADEVGAEHEERDGVAVVFELLAEAVREPGEAAPARLSGYPGLGGSSDRWIASPKNSVSVLNDIAGREVLD